MFSAKETDAEAKAKALAAFDEICAQIKALTEAEKLELSLSNYLFVIALEARVIGHENGLTATAAAQIYGASAEGFANVAEKLGPLPAEYQKALEAAQSLYVKVDGTLFNSSFDFSKKTAGYAHLNANLEKIKALTENGISFMNYCYPSGDGFYISASSPTSSASYCTSQLIGIVFNYYQDKITSEKNPSAPGYSSYIDRKKDSATGLYVCTFKSGKDAVSYKTAFDEYLAKMEEIVIPAAKDAYKMLVDIFGSVYGKNFVDAAMGVYEIGLKNFNSEADVAEIRTALDKYDAVEGNAKTILTAITGSSTLKVAARNVYPEIEFTAETTAQEVYDNQIKNEAKYVNQLIGDLRDVLTTILLNQFADAVAAVDLNDLDDETIEAVRALYADLPSSFQKKVDADTFAKFTKIVMPAVSHDTLEDVVKSFKATPINRAAINSPVAWTEEGIQLAADGTWELLLRVLKLAKVDIDLSNGLNSVLSDNLYQVSIVEALFDLYASLSHNETETGVSMAPTLGKVISLLVSPTTIKNCFVQPDNKYAAVIEKLSAVTVTAEEKEQGINEYDKFAEIEFTDADFGFKNGDKQGFIDALLAVLRPITYLLSGDNGILGMANVNIEIFDSIDSKGVYNEGIYSMLLPMLEELGITDLSTPAEFKANYDAQRAVHKNLGYDAVLREILEGLFDKVIQPVADDPMNGLITVLPRLAYVVDTNMLYDTVKTVIYSTGNTLAGLAGGLDLSAKAINKMISDIEITINEDAKIKLKPIEWDIIADCVTVSAEKSSVNSRDFFLLRTGEVDSCFTNIFFYIYNVVFADKDNFNAINGLVQSFATGQLLTIANNLIGMFTGDKYTSYRNYLAFATAGEKGKTPIPVTKSDAQKRFIDLSNQSFYDDYVAYTSVYNAFITGTNPPVRNMFSPAQTITRAMFITILYRMAGSPYDDVNPYGTKSPFTDIKDTSVYYYNAACWGLDQGVTNQTTFKPYDNVSREQTASMLYRYALANDMVDDDAYLETDLTVFSDYGTISEWAVDAMKWANANGMITGTTQGTANPKGATLRIHATKILYGFGRVCDIGSFK